MTKSRRMRLEGRVARMKKTKNACKTLRGTPEGKRPLEKSRRRWVDSIKIDNSEKG
jgi:hypothetical protein